MFTNDKVNAQLKRVLNVWSQFIASPASRYVLSANTNGGWFSAEAMREIPDFVKLFECDPEIEYFGYTSLDDYFTRIFRPGMRPVDSPHDNSIITSACESVPFALRHNVRERNTFWIKGEPYSLQHLLYNDSFAPQFAGGTVFQSFLSPLRYHRWHSPVDGRIVKIVPVAGTYYAISPTLGFAYNKNPDIENSGYSQAFLTNVATRMLIFIEADNSDIGLMVFAAIGMMEVSSCEATVTEGQRVEKGDELGMFHFGGSSYVMAFRPQTTIDFSPTVYQGLKDGKTPVYVRSRVGDVRSRR
jgi:phosphatidylserine decarboxylase